MDQPCCQPVRAPSGAATSGDNRLSPVAADTTDEAEFNKLSLNSSASKDGLSRAPREFSSRLENLQADLRLQILFSLADFRTLHSLVHPSPVMHAQYRAYRNSILHAYLGREVDGFTNAYAVMEAMAVFCDLQILPLTDKRLAALKDEYFERYSKLWNVCPYLASVEQNRLCSLASGEKPRRRRITGFLKHRIFARKSLLKSIFS